MFRRSALRVLRTCLAGVLAWAAGVQADINLPSAPPPQPISQSVQIRRGEAVTIPLRGVTRSGLQLSFLIRSRPDLGALGPVRVIDRGSASVVYSHDPARGPGVDRFRYAVQAPGSGVSTPAEVVIEILDRPPMFVAPDRMEFPAIAVGRTRTQEIEIRNDGGGWIQGRLELPEPWIFPQGDGSYALGEGGSARIAVTFAPQVPGTFSGTARFSHSGARGIILTGEAFSPIAFSPSRLELRAGKSGAVRTATLTLENRTDAKKRVEISVPDEIESVPDVELPPRGSATVTLQTRADALGMSESVVVLNADGLNESIPTRVYASPADVILQVPPSSSGVEFGKVLAGRSVHATIVMKNVGGSEASLRVTLPDGIRIDPQPAGAPLAPGEDRTFKITLNRPDASILKDSVRFSINGMKELEIPVSAEIETDVRALVARDPAGTVSPLPIPPRTAVRASGGIYPRVEEIGVTRRTKHELQVAWKHPSASIDRYVVRERKIDFNDEGEAIVVWPEVANASLEMQTDHAIFTITRLRPGQRLTLSITGFDPDGNASAPSEPFIVDSEHQPPFQIPWLWVGVAVVLISGFVIFRERRLRRLAQ